MEPRLKRLDEFSLHDLESVQLILRGSSIIDWHRLNLTTEEEVQRFLVNHELDPSAPGDRAHISRLQAQAVAYLRRNFTFSIPKPVEHATIEQLMMLASGSGHRQQCACAILKVLQIINHTAGRELLFCLPVSDRDLFHLVEEKVYRVVGAMLSEALPITEFVGGRKNLDSTYSKLLSKPEGSAVAIYDKLRFRIVTRSQGDLLPVLLYLSERLFPFNYIVPGQSANTIFHFRSYAEHHRVAADRLDQMQTRVDDELTPGANQFSDAAFKTIQFVTELPIRVPAHILEQAPPGAEDLGPVVYLLCEIQLQDADTVETNERGPANHEAYKRRQRAAVYRRLRLGTREPIDPKAVASAKSTDAPDAADATKK